MYDTLDLLLRLALIADQAIDKKQKKKLALKLVSKVSKATKAAILNKVLEAPSFKAETYEHVEWYLNMTETASEISKMGFPGMVIVGDEAMPLQIQMKDSRTRAAESGDLGEIDKYKVEFQEDRQWIIENEQEMQLAGAHAAMNFLNLKHLECQVILFRNRGFSGAPGVYEIEPGVANKFSRRLGNSQYFR